MNRLNYFHPYESKAGHHEDQITRAYLVLLRYSSHAFSAFIKYVRQNHRTLGKEKPITNSHWQKNDWVAETQKGNPKINTDHLLSILITDAQMDIHKSKVKPSKRNARYDGIITFGSELTMVIENKPRLKNVWIAQLNPSRQNLAANTHVYRRPAVLEWKEIIKQLNRLLSLPTVSGCEKMIIEDFLSFIDEKSPHLNPYDRLHLCKGSPELIQRRIYNLLKSIARDERLVQHNAKWGHYLQTPDFSQIRQIGLILNPKGGDYSIELSLYFGASQRQAIAFYQSNPDFRPLTSSEWKLAPNFHLAFRSTNLFWFRSPNSEHYLKFWKENTDKICQQKKRKVRKCLKWLQRQKVIKISDGDWKEMNRRFFKTKMPNLNIIPGFGVICAFSLIQAEELDKSGRLKPVLMEKIHEALKIVALNGNKVLKRL